MKSNSLLESIKGAIKAKGSMYLVIPKSKDEKGIPHFVWSDGNEYRHYTFSKKIKRKMKHWYNFLWFEGFVEDFPVEFLKNVRLRKIF